jgi:hypothetical protein
MLPPETDAGVNNGLLSLTLSSKGGDWSLAELTGVWFASAGAVNQFSISHLI